MIKHQLRRMEVLVNQLAAVLRGPTTIPPRQLQTAQHVIDLLQEQVEAIRAEPGARTMEKARAIGYVASIALRAIETGALSARLDVLEAGLKQRTQEPRR